MSNEVTELVTIFKNKQPYLYPYIMKKSTFDTYISLGILTTKHIKYFKLIDE